jgi:CHAD domain-containing protein
MAGRNQTRVAKALPLIAIDRSGPLRENAPLMLHIRLAEMCRYAVFIEDPDRVDDLHAMRIAAKRLRYTMEIFAPVLQSASGKQFDWIYRQVKSIQEQIGDIHDADVRVPLLSDFLDRHAASRPEIRIGLESLIASQRSQRDRLYRDFLAYWKKLERQGFRARFLRMLGMETELVSEEKLPGNDEDDGG